MLPEIMSVIISTCTLQSHLLEPKAVEEMFRQQAICQKYYARCMIKKRENMFEWDKMANCMAERRIEK